MYGLKPRLKSGLMPAVSVCSDGSQVHLIVIWSVSLPFDFRSSNWPRLVNAPFNTTDRELTLWASVCAIRSSDWMNVLLPLLFAPAKIVNGLSDNSVSSRIDLKLDIFQLVIIGCFLFVLVPVRAFLMTRFLVNAGFCLRLSEIFTSFFAKSQTVSNFGSGSV